MATRILVSNDYKETFDAVSKLIRAGAFYGTESAKYEVRGNAIYDGTYEYVLSGKNTDAEKQENHYFTPSGATWFKCLRGEYEQNDDAIWYNFMIDVREEYHKQYSVVVYEQLPKSKEELKKAQEISENIIAGFATLFCDELNIEEAEFHPVTDEKTVEDIFGASMRIELSAEATSGASLPLLCKVYFNRNSLGTKPLTWQMAKQYDREIASLIPEESRADECDRSEGVIANTIDAMEKLFNNQEINFADYTWLGEIGMPTTDDEERAANFKDENDSALSENERKQRRALRKMYIQMSHDNFALECQRVDLLYISHIKAESYVCDMYTNGTPTLRIELGINNSVTIKCLNCGNGDILVDRNEIFYEVKGVKKVAVLDLSRKNFGLSDEVIDEIKQHSSISKHFIRKTCMNICSQLKCKSQLFNINGELYCSDCSRQEIIYTDTEGKKFFTPTMTVATDTMKVYAPESAELELLGMCSMCKRTVSNENLERGMCKGVCASAANKNDKRSKPKKLYKTYRGVLPLTTRIAALTSSKRCYEDNEIVVFAVGNKKYILNKLNIKERGYLDKPYEVK